MRHLRHLARLQSRNLHLLGRAAKAWNVHGLRGVSESWNVHGLRWGSSKARNVHVLLLHSLLHLLLLPADLSSTLDLFRLPPQLLHHLLLVLVLTGLIALGRFVREYFC